MTKETSLLERTMTSAEKRKDTMLKKKYDDSDMKKNMQDQYGKEEGKKVYFATIRKQAMKEAAPLAAIPAVIGKGAAVLGKAALGTAKVTGKVAAKTAQATGKAAVKGTKAVGKAGLEGVKAGAYTAGQTVASAAGDIAAARMKKKFGVEEEVILERQKTNQGHRQSEEQHRSNYGKASIRNVRATGKGGNAASPDERGAAIDARRKAHKEKRGVKTKGIKEEVGISSAVRMKKAREEAMLRLKEKQAVARKMKKEEVEVVNEVSSKTLRNYIIQGTKDVAKRASDPDSDSGPKYGKKMKRMDGVMTAADKLARKASKNEEVEVVNEVSKKTLGSYVKKAATEIGTSAMKGDYKKMQKRHKGVLDASDKLQKEGAYMGPNKEDKKLIKKMDNPSYAKKLANYEKNMDPKKRQELKNKAIKGMKFTHEGTSYGLYKGSGKPGGAMKDYLDKKAEKLKKQRASQSQAARNNPHFDSTQPSPSGRNKYEEVQRDGYGDPIGGPKISKKQKAKNLASNTPDEQHTTTTSEAVTFQHFMEKCWKGYEKKGMKTMFGKRYPNCVKKEDVEFTDEGYGSDRVGPALKVARVIDRVNPRPKVGSKRTTISNMLKMASIKKDEKLRKQKENPYSAKNKLKMVVRSISQNARSKAGAIKDEYIPEEGYDIARDMGRVPKTRDKKDATTMPPSEEMKKTQKVYKGPSALELVKKKYGKAIMDVKKK